MMNTLSPKVQEPIAIRNEQDPSHPAVTVITLSGTLDVNTAEAFDLTLLGLLEKHLYQIVLNLKGLDYFSTAGLGVLVSRIPDFRRHGGDIKLAAVSTDIFKLFEFLEIQILFHMLLTDQDAVSAF